MSDSKEEALAHAKAQRAAVAEFGTEALRSNDLDSLLTKAAMLVAQGLSVERTKVLERVVPGDKLLIRAGVGWKPGVVGKVALDADIASPAGYALLTGEPVTSDDVEHDTRFRYPEVLREHGIKSAVNVIIPGSEIPFGVLEVDSANLRKFTRDDINFLQAYANLLAAAIERIKTHRELAGAEHQKDVLLRELQHRVKNSMQLILSFIAIERRKTSDEKVRNLLDTLRHRIDSLAAMYSRLSFSESTGEIDLCDYLEDLCREMANMPRGRSIKFDTQCVPLRLDVDQALPLGLLVNEFVSNSLKHAFPSGKGTVRVRLEHTDSDEALLTLSDNGIGAPDPPPTDRGSGVRLIAQLAEQAHGEVIWNIKSGTEVRVTFSVRRG